MPKEGTNVDFAAIGVAGVVAVVEDTAVVKAVRPTVEDKVGSVRGTPVVEVVIGDEDLC